MGGPDHQAGSLDTADDGGAEFARTDEASRPRAPLGPFSLFALGVNGIVGVGIFFAPREVASAWHGWSGVLVYLFVALLLLPTGLVYARLGRAFPKDGGPYLYACEAFGRKAGFAVGFTTYVSALFSTSTVIVGLVENSASAVGVTAPGTQLVVELALLSLLAMALSLGLRLSALAWSVVTCLKAAPLIALPLAACFLTPQVHEVRNAGLSPLAHPSLSLLGATLPVLFALQGFEIVPLPAAQVRRPERSVPLATLGSLIFAALLYAALHAACVRALPDLADHDRPLAEAAARYGGSIFSSVVTLATTVSAFGIAIGMVAMTPRYLAPLGHPDALGFGLDRQSARAVPLRAFLVTYVVLFAILVANAQWGSIRDLLALASLSVTLQYAVTAAALFFLSSRRYGSLRPRDGWPAPFALLAFVLFLLGSNRLEIPVLLGMIAFGFVMRAVGQMTRSARR